MKKYIVTVLLLLIGVTAFAQVQKGVTSKGEVTSVKDQGEVDKSGQINTCPQLTQYGEIISYAATMGALDGTLDGSVNIAVGIQVTSAENADSVGFELSRDADFTDIVGVKSFSPVTPILYQDTFKNLAAGETYYVRAFIANCPGFIYSDTVDVTTTGSYTLSFFARGGNGTMTAQGFNHGTPQRIKPNEFTRDNADFAGWTTDVAGCGTLYLDSAYMTLYSSDSVFAQWKTWCTGFSHTNEMGGTRIDSVSDHEGNWYKVVQIGHQCWLKENLRATTSVNGTTILTTAGSTVVGKRAHPISELGREGHLYNWSAAMDLADNTVVGTELINHRGLCPEGWHIPVQAEWDTLFALAKAGELAAYNCKIPSADYHWAESSVADAPGNDDSWEKNIYEFSSIPAGYYSEDRIFSSKTNAEYHTATSTSNTESYMASLLATSAAAHTVAEDSSKVKRSAVRCIRNAADFVTVTFNDNLGAGTEVTQTVQTWTDTVLDANSFVCPNGTFAGWNTDKKGRGTHYDDEAAINLSANLTLYAQWNRSCVGTAFANEVQNGIYVDSVRDYEGNAYATIRMGSQCWMRSNLNSSKYADGTTISTSHYKNRALTGKYYTATGVLRNQWDTTFAAPSGVQGVCPTGWHVPSITEWKQMLDFVRSNPIFVCGNDSVQYVLGIGVAKALASDTLWTTTTANACYPGYALSENNATGFNILPTGFYNNSSSFSNGNTFAYYWSTSYPNPTNSSTYYNVRINNALSYAYQDQGSSNYYYPVRCVRDIATELGEVVLDTAACSYIDVHATQDAGAFSSSYTYSIYKDAACTQPADGFKKVTRSADRKTVSARFYDLSPNTRYYIHFQYTSAFGTEIDTVLSATTACYCLASSALNSYERGSASSGQFRIDSVYDHEGHRYNVVQIGTQCWLKENMRATTSPSTNNSFAIIASGNIYSYSGKAAKWANATDTIKGLLYNWNAANDVYNKAYNEIASSTDGTASHHKDTVFTSINRGVCPLGWHVPSHDEVLKMEYSLTTANLTQAETATATVKGDHASKLISGRSWTLNTTANVPGDTTNFNRNISGFSLLPTGIFTTGAIANQNTMASIWTATQGTSTKTSAWYRHIVNSNAGVYRAVTNKYDYRSVRCVRDEVLKLGAAVFDSVACSFLETHIPVVQNVALTSTAAAFKDTACTQTAGGVTTSLSSAGDNVVARFWNLDGNTKYYLRYTVKNLDLEDTVIVPVKTACFCTVSRALQQPADYKNYEWGVSGATTSRVDSVSDHEGHRYGVVQIGVQCWTRENGRALTSPSTGDSLLKWIDATHPAYKREARWLRYDSVTFGYAAPVYSWCAMADYESGTTSSNVPAWYANRKGLCPEGWHMMTLNEWKVLSNQNSRPAVEFQGGPMVSGESETAWPTDYLNNTSRNLTGFTALPCGDWQQEQSTKFTCMRGLHLAAIDQVTATQFSYAYLKPTAFEYGSDPKTHSHSYRCLRDGDVELGDMVMDSISCTSAYFHAVVLNGTIDWSKTNICGYSDSSAFISNTSYTGTLTHSIDNDTLYGVINNKLACNKRYTFYFKVYGSDWQSYGVQLSDSTRDLSMVKPTSCVVTGTLQGHEVGNADTLTAVYDHQGNRYNVVQIGNQCWLKENMRATTSPTTGSRILLTTTYASNVSKYAYWYLLDSTTYSKNGVFYNWCAAVDTFYSPSQPEVAGSTNTSGWNVNLEADRRGICPAGWHIPTETEVNILAGSAEVGVGSGTGLVKLAGGCSWNASGTAGHPGKYTESTRNLTGFSAIPSGYFNNGSPMFNGIGNEANFWTATTTSTNTEARRMNMMYNLSYVRVNNPPRYEAHQVRCVRNARLDLGVVTLDTAACSYLEVHSKVLAGTPNTYTVATFADSACTQNVGGVTPNISTTKDSISARLWNLEGNTTYYVRITAQGNGQEDTVIGKFRTACFCTVSRALKQDDNITYKNYEWGSTTGGVSRVDSVSDHEGHRYSVVQIGSQCWTRENGRVITSPSGDTIIKRTNTGHPSYQREARWLENDSTRYGYFGPVYNWCAMVDYENGTTTVNVPAWYENRRGLCPQGWHMMSQVEWNILYSNANSAVKELQGGPMVSGGSHTAWPLTYQSDVNRNRTGFTALAGGEWKGSGFGNIGTIHFSSVDQVSSTTFRYYYILSSSLNTGEDSKDESHSYRCLRDGDVVLSPIVMDSISCTSAYFHTVVLNGTVDWNYTAGNRCGVSDSTGFISSMSTATAYKGAFSHRGDTIYGEFDNSLTCNKRYTFYFKVYDANKQAYGVQLSDSTRDAQFDKETSCVVPNLRLSNHSSTDLSHEDGIAEVLNAVYDHQGNRYKVVQIGNQCWMKENMRATTSPSTDTNILLSTAYLSTQCKAAYYYSRNVANAKYGVLYNWCAAVDTFNAAGSRPEIAAAKITTGWDVTLESNRRGICPFGWHVPTKDEFDTLATTAGVGIGSGTGSIRLAGGCDWTTTTTAGCPGNYTDATRNSTSFTAIPAGRLYSSDGSAAFNGQKTMSYFWASSFPANTTANSASISNSNKYLTLATNPTRYEALSVRCVRNSPTHTISFDANGGTGFMPAQTVNDLEETALNSNSFSRDNARFKSWNTERSGCGIEYADDATITTKGDITLYAQWNTYCPVAARSNETGSVANRIDSVKDHEDNSYSVVTINGYCVMKSNLRVKSSPVGNTLDSVISNTMNASCYIHDNNYGTEGCLYNWHATLDFAPDVTGSSITISSSSTEKYCGLCPMGWHVPVLNEWNTILSGYDGGQLAAYNGTFQGSGWNADNSNNTPGNVNDPDKNASGFSIVPVGDYYGASGGAGRSHQGETAYIWAASCSAQEGGRISLVYNEASYETQEFSKVVYRSVRCVRDE